MSDPPDAPPDSGLPEGVSLETASGVAVLRVSFDGDDERARRDAEERARMARAERDERAETTVLRHPETNVPVEIIGTAHVSALAARQTRELILRTKPDVVVLELDPNRLASMLRDAQLRTPARHLAETNVQTHLDALRVLYRGRTVQVIGGLAYAAVGAVLGSTPGAEFLAAIDAAKETGATVALGDADANVTTKRLFARTKWRKALRRAADRSNRSNRSSPETARSESDAERAPPLGDDATKKNKTTRAPVSVTFPDGSERPAPVPTPEAAVRLMADAGCDARGAERGAWHLVMHADPDPEDLLAVRACAAKVVELVRSEAYLEKHGTFDGDVTCTETETETETEKTTSGTPTEGRVSYSGGWAMDQTLRADRDLVLAHSLYRSASGAVSKNGNNIAPRRVVGVVGAAHVRGVKREWPKVREQSSVNRFDSALALTPEECTLEGARLRFGRDAVGWWDQPGYSETAAAAAAGLGVLGLSGFGARRVSSTTSVQNALATRVSSRLNRLAWFGVASVVGAGVVGTALTAHAMVELGRFAAKLERAAMAAEASGLAAPKKNELRSERWFETDALGRSVKNVFVDAVNVARPYDTRGGRWGEDDVER
jgi:pheromone shutdown protein TraB